MKLYKKFIPLLLILLCPYLNFGQTTVSQQLLTHQVDSIINSQIQDNKIPGAVVQITQNGKIVYSNALGYALLFNDQAEKLKQPELLTKFHLFDIASLTKVVATTTSIMLLSDKGLLDVDDKVGKFIPAFTEGEKANITIRHLLTHTSGIYEWYPMYYKASNKNETFQLIGSLPLEKAPGLQRKYSDLGFTILGQIIEIVSKQSLDTFVKKEVFEPLGMKNTGYNPLQTKSKIPIAATSIGNPYEHRMVYDASLGFRFKEIDPTAWDRWRKYTLKGEVNDGNAWYANKGVSGAAGIFSTIDDLQLLVDMLLHEGKVGDKQFISASTINKFLTKDAFNNGLGWMMDPINSFMKNGPDGSFGHTGFTGTSICIVPSKKLSVIILINRQQMGLINKETYYNVNPIREQVFKAAIKYTER